MIFRKALIKDVPCLSQLRVEMLNEENVYTPTFNEVLLNNTREFIVNEIEKKSIFIIVAEEENEIISMGWITYFILPPNDWCPSGKTAYVGNVYTVPRYRKRGIAKEIITRLVDNAKERSCERILLNTSELGENLYKKVGFEFSTTAMAFYPFGIIPQD